MASGSICTRVTVLKENTRIIKGMVLDFTTGLVEVDTKDSGKITQEMALEPIFGIMGTGMKGNGIMVQRKELACITG